jgi:hypothetical protein
MGVARGLLAFLTACSSAAAPPAVPSRATCDVTGAYRLRITWRDHDHTDFELHLAGTPPKATIDSEPRMLGMRGTLDAQVDPAACTVAIVYMAKTRDQEKLTMTLDPATDRVSGEILRGDRDPALAKHTGYLKPFTGVRNGGTRVPSPADTCFTRGIYRLAYDPVRTWTADEEDRTCDPEGRTAFPLIRVDWLGDELAIDVVEQQGTKWRDAGFVDEEFTRQAPCTGTLTLSGGNRFELEAALSFAPGAITGTATEVRYVVFQAMDSQGNEDGEAVFCRSRQVPLTIERIL